MTIATLRRTRTAVMGVVNVTPDSFSDGGRFADPDETAGAALRMAEEGAAWIDVGGESTRPGAGPVSVEDVLERVLPVLERLHGRLSVPVSIDTSKPEVARAALEAGASIVNDVRGLRDPALRELAAEHGASVVVMHMQGEPGTMQAAPSYVDPVTEIGAFLSRQAELLHAAGVPREKIHLDPGIGFGKTLAHNIEILRRIGELAALGHPLVVGTSRKSFLGALTGASVEGRLAGTLASVAWLALAGVDVVRVHDVRAAVDCLRVIEALAAENRGEGA